MATLLSANLRETVNSAAYLTSSGNKDKPLRINIRQCQLLAKKASETLFKLDNFSIFLQLQDSSNDSMDTATAWTSAVDGLCRVLENAEMLIEDCCCGDHWLEKAIFQGNLEETFAKILYEIEWHTRVLYSVLVAEAGVFQEGLCNGKLCLTDDISLKAAAKKDLASLLQLLKDSHVCDEEVCKFGCLATKLFAKLDAQEVENLNSRSISKSVSPRILWVPPEHLHKGIELGKGAFGTISEAKWLGQVVAWKLSNCLAEFYIQERDSVKEKIAAEERECVKEEIAAMAGLNHPHVMRVVCCTENPVELGIVMERMEKSLYEYVKETKRKKGVGGQPPVFSIDESVDLMLQIAEGMRYIHNNGLAYRDLKSENILLQRSTPFFIAKIADFGLSKVKNDSTAYGNQSLGTGTRRWMAPEMFDPKRIKGMIKPAPSDRFHPKKVDVWSFGITCSEILCGETPYGGGFRLDSDLYGALKGGTRPKLPEGVPQRLLALIQRCWDWNPNLRPKFPGICAELRFIKGLLLRGDSSALQSTSIDVGSVFHAKTAVKIQGPWGGNGGSPFCTGGLTSTIKQIKLKFDAQQGNQIGRIWYIEIEYDINGNSVVSAHGDANHGSRVETIKVDWPREYFTQIEGSFSMDSRQVINVTTLTLYTNDLEKRQYGPFGGVSDASGNQGSQTRFTSEVGRVVGFQGRVGEQSGLISIGCFTVAADE